MSTITPLYSVKGFSGAHFMHGMRECEITETPGAEPIKKIFAKVQLIGSLLPFDVPFEDLSMFDLSNKYQGEDITISLAQEAATIYNQEAKRVQKAAELNRDTFAVQIAKRDKFGDPIHYPTWKTAIVKGSDGGWYVISKGECTCQDHKRGNTCKHRIAVWMRRESIARPLAAARRVPVAQIISEVLEV